MTPTDGAGAVPAGGGSSLPLPGGPGIDPAGIMTGARGASLKRDAKAKVTPAHCIARSAARIEPRQMAEASAAVERRKASASRWTRGRARSARRWQHLLAWRGPTGQLRLFGAPPPLIFWRQKNLGFGSAKLGRGCVARTRALAPSAPALAGEGDHWSWRNEQTWRGRRMRNFVVVAEDSHCEKKN